MSGRDTAILFASFGGDPYRLRLLEYVISRLLLQEYPHQIAIGFLNWPTEKALPSTFSTHTAIHLTGDVTLFQKEAIYNRLEQALPQNIDKLVFLDGDVFPLDTRWLQDVVGMLSKASVGQVFSQVHYLAMERTRALLTQKLIPQCHTDLVEAEEAGPPALARLTAANGTTLPSYVANSAGNSGIGWAVRRDVFRKLGGFPWQEVFAGFNCSLWASGLSRREYKHPFLSKIAPQLGVSQLSQVESPQFVPHHLYHLYHKSGIARHYGARLAMANFFKFDPVEDVFLNATGGIELTSKGKRLSKPLQMISEVALSTEGFGNDSIKTE